MLIGLPAVTNSVHLPVLLSIGGILVLGLSAGLTNPRQIGNAVLNAIIATVGFVIFEVYTVNAYQNGGADSKFFATNLILGFLFLFAVYFSMKTLRGLSVLRNSDYDYDDES